MHMADALMSAEVGAAMWAVSAGTIACCSARLGRGVDDRRVPLMGVLGAFLFAAQMINFSIPGTGSSGHLGGGLLLAILLGPGAALLTIASVLVVQALFFADGGLLALGCNIFNVGVIPALIVYPFCYRNLIGNNPAPQRLTCATMISAVLALQLGSFAVVLETLGSGMSSLPFAPFAWLMQPIHLAIGLVEGAVTVAVVSFVRKARPDLLPAGTATPGRRSPARLLVACLACALLTAGAFSGLASRHPDGLEWSIAKVTGKPELSPVQKGVHGAMAAIQGATAWFPEYDFKRPAASVAPLHQSPVTPEHVGNLGTGIAGITGTVLTLLFACALGLLLKRRNQ